MSVKCLQSFVAVRLTVAFMSIYLLCRRVLIIILEMYYINSSFSYCFLKILFFHFQISQKTQDSISAFLHYIFLYIL